MGKPPEFTEEKTKAQKYEAILYILLLAKPEIKSRWPDSDPLLSTYLSLQLFMNAKN